MLEIVEREANGSRGALGLMRPARAAVCAERWSGWVAGAVQTRSLLAAAAVPVSEVKGRPGPRDLRPHEPGGRLPFGPS